MISFRFAVALGSMLLASWSSAAQPDLPTGAHFPKALQGHWMPQDLGCPVPINYDSDALVVISEEVLNGYEDSSTPFRVSSINSGSGPAAWLIDSYLHVAGDDHDTKVTEIFLVTSDQLVIADNLRATTYRRCK